MERDEALQRTDHYRCRLCRQISPITETLCTRPGCRAQLGIYGELITAEENKEDNTHQGTKVTSGSDQGNGGTGKPEKPKKEKSSPGRKSRKRNLLHRWKTKQISPSCRKTHC